MSEVTETKKQNVIEILLGNIHTELATDENYIAQIKSMDAESFSVHQHHGMGQYIRNEFIFKPTGIADFFKSVGIHLPDDMSDIILFELHKYTSSQINGIEYSYTFSKKIYPSMNIYALQGHKVKVTSDTLSNGTREDANLIIEHLNIDYKYTVDKTIVKESQTEVYLMEREGIVFNSINFEDVTSQSQMSDTTHPDYNKQ